MDMLAGSLEKAARLTMGIRPSGPHLHGLWGGWWKRACPFSDGYPRLGDNITRQFAVETSLTEFLLDRNGRVTIKREA